MISAASKCGAAMSARCIMSTAPTAKFGATMPPTPLALHAVSSLSTSVALSPVVPTIGEAPAATAASALCSASEGRVKSTSARGRFSCKNSARSSPRPIPPTYSISGSPCSPMASTDPTLPRCPATATRIVTCPLSVAAWAPVSASTVAAATIPSTESTLSRRRRRRERGRHHLGVDAFVDRLTSGRQLLDRRLAAQVEPALAVDLDRLDHDLVADVAHLLNPLDAVAGELGDVNQAVLAGQHLNEGAEWHDAHDLALVELTDLDLVCQSPDPVDRLLARDLVDRRDEYAPVVLDIDLCAGLFGDLADRLSSRADHVADLVGVDQDRGDAGRVGAHLGPRLRQDRKHLVEHEQPRLTSLLQRLGHDLVGQALDLDVHLEGRDAVPRAGHLEVHVAQRVLDALDVGEDGELALAGHQAHRDAGHRCLDRHAGVHERKGGTANRGHRGRAVGAEDLGDHADRVGPVLDRRDHGQQRPLRERSVPNLAPAGAAQGTRLAHREGWEVVVVQVALELFGGQPVELLLVGHGTEGCDGERLRLAAGEKPRAMRPWQHADLDGDRAHVLEATTVDAHALFDDALPDAVFHRFVEELADDVGVLGETLAQLDDRLGAEIVHGVLAALLVSAVHDLVEAQGEVFTHDLDHLLGVAGGDPLALFDPDLLLQLELGSADPLDLLVRQRQRVEHHLLAYAPCARLDHEDGIGRPGDHEVEVGIAYLRHRRVDDDLAVDVAHAHRSDRALERYVGDHEGAGTAVDAEDRRIVLLVDRQHGRDDLHVEAKALRKQRAQRTVGEPRGEDGLLAGPSFAAHERAGDLAGGVQLLFVIAREREEVDPLPRLLRHHGRAQHDGVALPDVH